MSKVDISKIKPGDEVQVANGDWYEAAYESGMFKASGILVTTLYSCGLITGHKPAKPEPTLVRVLNALNTDTTIPHEIARAIEKNWEELINFGLETPKPEPPVEWVTEEMWEAACTAEGDGSNFDLKRQLNQVLREDYGQPPVPRVYNEGDVVPFPVHVWDPSAEAWYLRGKFQTKLGEIWLPQPPAPEVAR